MYLNHLAQDKVLAAGSCKHSDNFIQPTINKVQNKLREKTLSLVFLLHASIRLDHHQGESVIHTGNTEAFYIEYVSILK
jgi:hypothetical protein